MTSQSSLLSTMMSSSFDKPFDMLSVCHDRVRHMLALLERLGDHLDQIGADQSARGAARDLLRFFDLAAVHLHDDEELHIVPRLRSLGCDVLAQRLLDEHRALARDWDKIREGLSKLSTHSDELPEGLTRRRASWQRYARDYRAHMALEEREVFSKVAS
jgi:hemerythrin-like domain-containing protein